ncbi:MAG: NifU family protein [Bacteroidota bacterium]|jgi:Fe-S cluster biogenesis protein NfuA|nr:NifU family protein [Bacteroidota bacterium]
MLTKDQEKQNSRHINLYMEANPNPNSMKFVVNYMLLPEGISFDFPDKESANASPLASELFQLPYVERVFFMSNFITITKNPDIDWIEINNELKSLIKEYLQADKPLILDVQEDEFEEDDTEINMKIKNILDEYIRPAVEQDGGAISFHSYEDGVVKVLLQGACSGCPSSTITLKAGIENLLKRMIPEIQSVEAIGV